MKTTRDLSQFYTGVDDPKRQQDTQQAKQLIDAFVTKWKGRTDYLDDATLLLEALEEYNHIRDQYTYGTIESMYLYLLDVISDDEQIQAALTKTENESTRIFNALTFFELTLGTIPEDKQGLFLMDVRLKKYHHYLSELFKNAKYQLSEKEEQLISRLSRPAYHNWTRMVEDFIFGETVDYEGETVTVEGLLSMISDQDKKKRDRAAEQFNGILQKYLKTAEKEYNSVIEYKHQLDELRGYDMPERGSYIRDGVSEQTVTAMSQAVQETYNLSNDFYAFKAKLLGVDVLQYHERNVPIVAGGEHEYHIDEAVHLVKESFGGLKGSYADFVQEMFDLGRVDVFPKAGKRGGAFCITDLNASQGPVVLLNHTNKLRDVLTIAHEFGHALNAHLSSQTHQGVNHGSGGFMVAEVASTFFEGIVFDKLLSTIEDPQKKIALLMNNINDEISTIHRQIASYEFEREIHAQKKTVGYLSHEKIGSIYQKHMQSYMGKAVEQSPGSKNRWLYIGHFRMFFYNYAYAGGILIANALREKLSKQGSFINQIEENYFKNSNVQSAKEIFGSLGIDITKKATWESGLKKIQKQLDQVQALVDEHGRDVSA